MNGSLKVNVIIIGYENLFQAGILIVGYVLGFHGIEMEIH